MKVFFLIWGILTCLGSVIVVMNRTDSTFSGTREGFWEGLLGNAWFVLVSVLFGCPALLFLALYDYQETRKRLKRFGIRLRMKLGMFREITPDEKRIQDQLQRLEDTRKKILDKLGVWRDSGLPNWQHVVAEQERELDQTAQSIVDLQNQQDTLLRLRRRRVETVLSADPLVHHADAEQARAKELCDEIAERSRVRQEMVGEEQKLQVRG